MQPNLADQIPQPILNVCQKLQRSGFFAYIVGGAVRDMLRDPHSLSLHDFDIATSAHPDQVMKLFGHAHAIPTGLRHGTVTVLVDLPPPRNHVEITTFRVENTYQDNRRPDSVVFVDDIVEDLRRRDFTINAIAYDPISHCLKDPFGGQEDLGRCLIRAVGDPIERFTEDGLRPLRAVRFASQLGFAVDAHTRQAIPQTLAVFRKVSRERIRDELLKLLQGPHVTTGLMLLYQTGLWEVIFPEQKFEDVAPSSPPSHAPPYASLPAAPSPASIAALFQAIAALPNDPLLRLALLLHPLWATNNLRLAIQNLKLSAQQTQRILAIPNAPSLPDPAHTHAATWRRFLSQTSSQLRADRMAIEQALWQTSDVSHKKASLDSMQALQHVLNIQLATQPPLTLADLALTGKEIMQLLNIPAGKEIGRLMQYLLDCVLEDPMCNTAAQLGQRIKEKKNQGA